MAGRLTGKAALVTGGTKGIGRAIVRAFVAEGAKVVFTGRSEELGKKLVAELNKGQDVVYVKGDMLVRADLENSVKKTLESFGKIDILVNNAGIFPVSPFLDTDEKGLDQVFGTNQRGLFILTQIAAKAMATRKEGNIINIASIQGLQGFPLQAHYSATKGASMGLVRALAAELGPMGIRVNAMAPGVVMTEGIAENIPPELVDILLRQTPLGRIATSEDCADCAVFLASEESRAITGQVITVDSGYSSCRMFV